MGGGGKSPTEYKGGGGRGLQKIDFQLTANERRGLW